MNLSDFFKSIWPITKEYYWIAFAPIVIYGFILTQAKKEDIDQNKSITYGIVKRSRRVTNQLSKRHYYYDFSVNGQKFSGSSIGRFSDDIDIGNYYTVEFSTKNPEHSRMDFEIEYSPVVQTNALGEKDTTYIRTSEMKMDIPEEYKNRIENLKRDSN